MVGSALLALCLAACGGKKTKAPDPEPQPALEKWSDAWILAEGQKYLEDPVYRRAALEKSLFNHDNSYSRQRLGSYGIPGQGWDALPVWNPKSVGYDRENAEAEPQLLWDGVRPTTMAGWVALGEKVFFGYPMRSEVFLEWMLSEPKRELEVGAAVGVARTAAGRYPGIVTFDDIDGRRRIGITCAVCHSTVENDQVVVGQARRKFDYGALRLAYHEQTGEPVDPELARRMRSWGPGRADVTEDEGEDPVAIPDLWGIRHQTSLTQAGTIVHESPLALAIRQETQLLHSNHQRVRPPRELSWALAMYVYSLKPPRGPETPLTASASAEVAHGRELFEQSCRGCHSNEAYGGKIMPAEKIGVDRALSDGKGRGTGHYRPPSLLRIAEAGPYLHHGVVPTLEDLFGTARLGENNIARGHKYGTDWPAPDKAAIIAFLRTL